MAQRTTRGQLRGRKGNMTGFVVLGLCILGSGYLISRASHTPAPSSVVVQQPVVGQFDTVSIPVPAQVIPSGTQLRNVKFRMVRFPAHQVPDGAVRDITPFLDGVARTPLPAQLPIFRENISLSGGSSNPVIEQIPDGMRAMTIRVDATSAVEGWAGSGSIVDVLLVQPDGTSVIAEQVKVLSAERSVEPMHTETAPSIPSTVTLLVSQEQCLAIHTAIPLGRIAFALRNLADEGEWGRAQYRTETLKSLGKSGRGGTGIQGFVSVHQSSEDSPSDAFALTDSGWVKTDIVPKGFFPKRER